MMLSPELAFFAPRYAEFVKAVDRRTLLALERIAAKMEPALRDAFLAAVRSARSQMTLETIATAIGAIDPAAAIRAASGGLEFNQMRQTLADIIEASGRITTQSLIRTTGATLAQFTMLNPYAARYAINEVGNLITEITRTTQEGIMAIIENSILGNATPYQSAKQIMNWVGLTSQQMNWVMNYENRLIMAGASDIDEKTQRYANKILRYRANTIARTECLPAQSRIDAAVVRAVFRRWYECDLIEIRTEDGGDFAATTNHPMLTNTGWIAANNLKRGDYLIGNDWQQNASSSGYKDINRMPATIREIFDSVAAIGIRERRITRKPDFHGDGRDGNVDIFRTDRELNIGNFATIFKPLIQQLLAPSDLARFRFCGQCGRLLPVNQRPCFYHGANSDLIVTQDSLNESIRTDERFSQSFNRLALLIAFNYLLMRQISAIVRRSSVAQEKILPRVFQIPTQARFSYPTNIKTNFVSDFTLRQSANIKLHRIKSIGARYFRGHLFNLETRDGYFIANGFYTGNTMDAANAGQQAAWKLAVDQGFLPADVEQRWVASPDACPEVCEPMPEMDENQHVPLDGFFLTADGRRVRRPPESHPNCKCTVGLNL